MGLQPHSPTLSATYAAFTGHGGHDWLADPTDVAALLSTIPHHLNIDPDPCRLPYLPLCIVTLHCTKGLASVKYVTITECDNHLYN